MPLCCWPRAECPPRLGGRRPRRRLFLPPPPPEGRPDPTFIVFSFCSSAFRPLEWTGFWLRSAPADFSGPLHALPMGVGDLVWGQAEMAGEFGDPLPLPGFLRQHQAVDVAQGTGAAEQSVPDLRFEGNFLQHIFHPAV